MSKTEVRTALAGAIMPLEEESKWLLLKNGQYLGTLVFSGDHLLRAERELSPFDLKPGSQYAAATYDAIADMIRTGETSCSLSVDSLSGTGWESRAAYLKCGDRYIVVLAKRSRDHGNTGEIKDGAGPLPPVEPAEP
jgi:hypothetical protein